MVLSARNTAAASHRIACQVSQGSLKAVHDRACCHLVKLGFKSRLQLMRRALCLQMQARFTANTLTLAAAVTLCKALGIDVPGGKDSATDCSTAVQPAAATAKTHAAADHAWPQAVGCKDVVTLMDCLTDSCGRTYEMFLRRRPAITIDSVHVEALTTYRSAAAVAAAAAERICTALRAGAALADPHQVLLCVGHAICVQYCQCSLERWVIRKAPGANCTEFHQREWAAAESGANLVEQLLAVEGGVQAAAELTLHRHVAQRAAALTAASAEAAANAVPAFQAVCRALAALVAANPVARQHVQHGGQPAEHAHPDMQPLPPWAKTAAAVRGIAPDHVRQQLDAGGLAVVDAAWRQVRQRKMRPPQKRQQSLQPQTCWCGFHTRLRCCGAVELSPVSSTEETLLS